MYLIIGLGNPDKKYLNTYHNVGFLCADTLAARLGAEFVKGECRAITAHARLKGEKVIVAKPVTYMNLSGESATELIRKYKVEKEKFLVMYDDVDLPLGALRIRYTGSAGTHNGMRSIVNSVHTEDFVRFRVGIGRDDSRELRDYVLYEIDRDSMTLLSPAITSAALAAYDFASGTPVADIMQKYNKKL